MNKKRVVVGLSGGVDSSVCALLLLEQGYEVIGIFMRNWHDETVVINNECPWIDDSNDAILVAEKLGIPFQVLDLSAEYKTRIVDYMFAEYEAGRTPNPDVLCNREIKFDSFLKVALSLNADYVATGHYCQKAESEVNGQTQYHLIAGADKNKDQSYFLCQLNQDQLAKALFPIGHLQKSEVRKLAEQADLVTANKKDSQGLCFIGKVSLPEFLQQKLAPKKGFVREIPAHSDAEARHIQAIAVHKGDSEAAFLAHSQKTSLTVNDGSPRGEHNGAHYYTIGQRKGLGIGGSPLPLFILDTDVDSNTIYVGQGEDHWVLNRKGLKVKGCDVHWLNPSFKPSGNEILSCTARIRYRQALEKVKIRYIDGDLYLLFENAQRGISPGQFAAFYHNTELIGSGVID